MGMGGVSVPSDTQDLAAFVWRLFCVVVAAVSLGGSTYFVVSSRVPLILAFIPLGEVTRDDSPIMFWMIVASGLIAGILGLVGLFRRIGNTNKSIRGNDR